MRRGGRHFKKYDSNAAMHTHACMRGEVGHTHLLHDGEGPLVGGPYVQHQRLAQVPGQLDLLSEDAHLAFLVGRMRAWPVTSVAPPPQFSEREREKNFSLHLIGLVFFFQIAVFFSVNC